MATLTYDPTPADQPEFSEEEQDSLRVGEELAEQQANLLAGKFKDAEDLEKAYLELQKKLGTNDGETDETLRDEAGDEERTEEEVDPTQALIAEASAAWAEKQELSPEMMEQLTSMNSQDLVKAYIAMYGDQSQENQAAPVADLTDAQVATIKQDAGGEEEFNNILQWAADNLDPSYVKSYDNLVETGNYEAIQLAVAGLKSAYDSANGYEGRMLTGKGAPVKSDVFRSQAEVVAAMGDPRYDRDPAYRQDVFAKLERSNIYF